MKRFLKRHNEPSKWLEVLADPFKYLTVAELNDHVERSKSRIAQALEDFGQDQVGICWSGGKDSEANFILADSIAQHLPTLYCSACPTLEFSASLRWRQDFAPDTLEEKLVLTREDVERDFEGFLRYDLNDEVRRFHANKALQLRWKTQYAWAQERKLKCLVFGRRTIDGNFCGKGGRYISKNGITALNPIYDWSHEVVIAYLVSNSRIPYIYEQPESWNIGPRYWVASSYSHVAAVEPSILAREAVWIRGLVERQASIGLEPDPRHAGI